MERVIITRRRTSPAGWRATPRGMQGVRIVTGGIKKSNQPKVPFPKTFDELMTYDTKLRKAPDAISRVPPHTLRSTAAQSPRLWKATARRAAPRLTGFKKKESVKDKKQPLKKETPPPEEPEQKSSKDDFETLKLSFRALSGRPYPHKPVDSHFRPPLDVETTEDEREALRAIFHNNDTVPQIIDRLRESAMLSLREDQEKSKNAFETLKLQIVESLRKNTDEGPLLDAAKSAAQRLMQMTTIRVANRSESSSRLPGGEEYLDSLANARTKALRREQSVRHSSIFKPTKFDLDQMPSTAVVRLPPRNFVHIQPVTADPNLGPTARLVTGTKADEDRERLDTEGQSSLQKTDEMRRYTARRTSILHIPLPKPDYSVRQEEEVEEEMSSSDDDSLHSGPVKLITLGEETMRKMILGPELKELTGSEQPKPLRLANRPFKPVLSAVTKSAEHRKLLSAADSAGRVKVVAKIPEVRRYIPGQEQDPVLRTSAVAFPRNDGITRMAKFRRLAARLAATRRQMTKNAAILGIEAEMNKKPYVPKFKRKPLYPQPPLRDDDGPDERKLTRKAAKKMKKNFSPKSVVPEVPLKKVGRKKATAEKNTKDVPFRAKTSMFANNLERTVAQSFYKSPVKKSKYDRDDESKFKGISKIAPPKGKAKRVPKEEPKVKGKQAIVVPPKDRSVVTRFGARRTRKVPKKQRKESEKKSPKVHSETEPSVPAGKPMVQGLPLSFPPVKNYLSLSRTPFPSVEDTAVKPTQSANPSPRAKSEGWDSSSNDGYNSQS